MNPYLLTLTVLTAVLTISALWRWLRRWWWNRRWETAVADRLAGVVQPLSDVQLRRLMDRHDVDPTVLQDLAHDYERGDL